MPVEPLLTLELSVWPRAIPRHETTFCTRPGMPCTFHCGASAHQERPSHNHSNDWQLQKKTCWYNTLPRPEPGALRRRQKSTKVGSEPSPQASAASSAAVCSVKLCKGPCATEG